MVDFAIARIERYYPNCRDALQCVSTFVHVSNPKSSLGQALNPPGAEQTHQYLNPVDSLTLNPPYTKEFELFFQRPLHQEHAR